MKYWYGLIIFFFIFLQRFSASFPSFVCFVHLISAVCIWFQSYCSRVPDTQEKKNSKQMIKCWSRLLLLCMQFDHWTCYKTLLVFHLSTSSRDDQSYRLIWVSEWYFRFCVQCSVNTNTKQNGGNANENIIVNNLNFIPVLIFSQEVHRWPAYIYLYLFMIWNWDSGGEVAPNIYDNRLVFNCTLVAHLPLKLMHAMPTE